MTDLHNASVILSGDPAVMQLGDDQFVQRLQAYLDLAPTLRERVPDIDYVDLRFDDRIYVRPAGTPRGDGFGAAGPLARGEDTGSEAAGLHEPEAEWRVKSGIWSASTSAPRR